MGIRNIKKILIPVALVAVFAMFQNCSRNAGESTNSAPSSKGNGEGYTGKIFINHVAQASCADGSDVNARIVASSSTKGILNRENCQDISPREVNLNQDGNFTVVPSAFVQSIVYDKHVYDESSAPRTSYLCHIVVAQNGLVRVTDVTVRKFNNEFSAYIASYTAASENAPALSSVDAKFNGIDEITGLPPGSIEFKGNYAEPDGSIEQHFSLNMSTVNSMDYQQSGTAVDPVSLSEYGMSCYTP